MREGERDFPSTFSLSKWQFSRCFISVTMGSMTEYNQKEGLGQAPFIFCYFSNSDSEFIGTIKNSMN